MKHSIRKSEIIKRMGLKLSLKEYDGPRPQNIKVTGTQFDRLLEEYMDYEEFEMGEDFGDGDLELSDPQAQSMVTQSADDYYSDTESASELDELDMAGEEDIDEMWGQLAKIAAGALATGAGERLASKYMQESRDISRSLKSTYRSIRECIKREKPKGIKLRNYNSRIITEGWTEPGSPSDVGSSAAAGIENIIDNIKKAYTFVKDSRTRRQIANTLTKLNNFMTYSAELVGSGQSQRAPRSYDQLANPLPYPELEQSAQDEDYEDIDDEINITERFNPRTKKRVSIKESRRLWLSEQTDLTTIATALEDSMKGLGTDEKDLFAALTAFKKSGAHFKELQAAYKKLYKYDIIAALDQDLNNADMKKAMVLLGLGNKLPGWNPRKVARELYDAMDGIGTDESKLYNALQRMPHGKGEQVSSQFKALTKGDELLDWLQDDLNDADFDKAVAILGLKDAGTKTGGMAKGAISEYSNRNTNRKRRLTEVQGINAERIAKELYDSMDGLGTDETKFWGIIQPTGRQKLSADEQQDIQTAFKNLYDDDLCDWIRGDFGGSEERKALEAVGCSGGSGMRGRGKADPVKKGGGFAQAIRKLTDEK